jgi:hypothetical protein
MQLYLLARVRRTGNMGHLARGTFERAEIDHQILQRMTKFMTNSRLFKTPGHKPKKTDIHLWKLSSEEYYNERSDEIIRIFKCPMAYRCYCKAKCRVSKRKTYLRFEFHGTHDETSHSKERSKKLKHQHIIAMRNVVIVAPNQSASKLLTTSKMRCQKNICNRHCSDQCSGLFERQEKNLQFGNYPSVE